MQMKLKKWGLKEYIGGNQRPDVLLGAAENVLEEAIVSITDVSASMKNKS